MIVGLIGAFFPEVFGVGYQTITNVLTGQYTIFMLFVLVIAKFAATAITMSCRFGGGIFSPGLVIGVMIGAAFGGALSYLFPGMTANPIYYAMIGMGAFSGAILGAPISTTLIIFELTGDYGITISLMVAVAIATFIVQSVCGKAFFHWQLSRRGYDLSEGPQGVILQTIRVRDVMDKMPESPALSAEALRLEVGQSLGDALATLGEEDGLPVVSPKQPEAVIGYLSRVKALSAYNKALIEDNIEHYR